MSVRTFSNSLEQKRYHPFFVPSTLILLILFLTKILIDSSIAEKAANQGRISIYCPDDEPEDVLHEPVHEFDNFRVLTSQQIGAEELQEA